MLLLSALIWTLLLCPALPLRHCNGTEVQDSPSPLLQSLQCHNDYESHVSCQWTEESHQQPPLQLWIQTLSRCDPCPPDGAPVLHEDGRQTVRCRYQTRIFSVATSHTAFFREANKSCCPPPRQPAALQQHLQALPPTHLAPGPVEGRTQRLWWSSPYPGFSPLTRNMTYQVGYKSDREDEWKIVAAPRPSVTLSKLHPGHTYRARVRGRTAATQWSVWSPEVTWRTPEDSSQGPGLRCVLTSEETAQCHWDVSRDRDRFLSYRLDCGPGRCSVEPAAVSDASETRVTYSCRLRAPEPGRLQLQLLPSHRSRTFRSHQQIRPSPPTQLRVSPEGSNWSVQWTKPLVSSYEVSYQVCFFQTKTRVCSALWNVSATSLPILGSSLASALSYSVLVRTVVEPGSGSEYEGIPSEWAGPVEWTSHAASWSVQTLVYVCTGLLVATIFLALYFSIPACHRRAVLWVDSVPSPQKSRVISEFRPGSKQHVMLAEKTSLCSVHHLDRVLPGRPLILPVKGEGGDLDRGYWSSENSPLPDQSVIGFTGPYILCKESLHPEVTERRDEGGAYVCLPALPASGSTQDLFQPTNTYICNCPDPDSPDDGALATPVAPEEPGTGDPYVSGPFTSWPSIKASGYCSLPAHEAQ